MQHHHFVLKVKVRNFLNIPHIPSLFHYFWVCSSQHTNSFSIVSVIIKKKIQAISHAHEHCNVTFLNHNLYSLIKRSPYPLALLKCGYWDQGFACKFHTSLWSVQYICNIIPMDLLELWARRHAALEHQLGRLRYHGVRVQTRHGQYPVIPIYNHRPQLNTLRL